MILSEDDALTEFPKGLVHHLRHLHCKHNTIARKENKFHGHLSLAVRKC